MRRRIRFRFALIMLGVVLLVAGCASRPMGAQGDPGFWLGLFHGIVAPFSLVASLFTDDIRMYAFPNIGRWYDFGFFLGVGGLAGSAASQR